MPPEEDRATATGDLHKKNHEGRSSAPRDMLADRQTDTHRQTDKLIAIPGGVTILSALRLLHFFHSKPTLIR